MIAKKKKQMPQLSAEERLALVTEMLSSITSESRPEFSVSGDDKEAAHAAVERYYARKVAKP